VSAVTPDRVGNDSVLMTAAGYEQLRSELEALSVDGRRQMSGRLREAREDGHLADNPALYDLLVEQAQLERRITTLEEQLAAAEIVVPAADGIVGIGTGVRVRDLATGEVAAYELVGETESDAGNGRVSVGAPIGRALAGRGVGETVDVETPRGTLAYEILSVQRLVRQTPAARIAA
jgi:transcription elongation factor GreA